MKTISDLKALVPRLTALMLDNPEIGERFQDGSDYNETTADNYVSYDDDGWCVEVSFQCCGVWDYDRGDWATPPSWTLQRAWGEVTDLTASHYDETTDEETLFVGKDLNEIWRALDRSIETLTIN